jgi:hypothetical protein
MFAREKRKRAALLGVAKTMEASSSTNARLRLLLKEPAVGHLLSQQPEKPATSSSSNKTLAPPPKRRTFDRSKDVKKGAEASGEVKMSFDEAVAALAKDPEKMLESAAKARYNPKTVKAQDSAFVRYSKACGAVQIDPAADPTAFALRIFAAVLMRSSNIANSTTTIYANLKGYKTRVRKLEPDAAAEYSKQFKILDSQIVRRQATPILLSTWLLFDKLGKGVVHKVGGRSVDLNKFLGFVAVNWFLLLRPSEAEVTDFGDDCGNQREFKVRCSKVDQVGKGADFNFICCCAQMKKLGLKRIVCPVHSSNKAEFKTMSGLTPAHRNELIGVVCEQLGIPNEPVAAPGNKRADDKYERRPWSNYSIRIGGERCAALGGLGADLTTQLGRWKSRDTKQHYEGGVQLANKEEYAILWPLKRCKVL